MTINKEEKTPAAPKQENIAPTRPLASAEPVKSPRLHLEHIPVDIAGGGEDIYHQPFFHGYITAQLVDEKLVDSGDFLVHYSLSDKKIEGKYGKEDQMVISVRMGPSFYVHRDYKDWGLAWKAARGSEDDGRIKTLLEYLEMPTEERKEYVLIESGIGQFHINYFKNEDVFWLKDNECCFDHITSLLEYHQVQQKPLRNGRPYSIIKKAASRETWQFNKQCLDRVKRLGSGEFGQVYKAILFESYTRRPEVAAKETRETVNAEGLAALLEEAMLMRRLKHPNVLRLIGIQSMEKSVQIILELADEKTDCVLKAIRSKTNPSLAARITYILEAARGLAYIHEKYVAHRDIAARNVLIGKDGSAKISDFGLSITGTWIKVKSLTGVPVSLLPPEVPRSGLILPAGDVFAFGMYIYEVFHNGPEDLHTFLDSNLAIKEFCGKRKAAWDRGQTNGAVPSVSLGYHEKLLEGEPHVEANDEGYC